MADERQRMEIFELVERCVHHKNYSRSELDIVKNVVFQTADFDYASSLVFSEGAVDRIICAMMKGQRLVTDAKMVRAGLLGSCLEQLKVDVTCFANAPGHGGLSMVDLALADPGNQIFVFANTPETLTYFLDQVGRRDDHPYFVIAAPVGFVGVAQAKQRLKESGLPYVMADGMKGGSEVAVEITNTLLEIAVSRLGLESER